jgi:diguanylate cyclase (GGDEF)-like protein/PAS domain S-box-containing protein
MTLLSAPTSAAAWSALLGPATDVTTEALVVQDRTGRVRAANRAARALAELTGEAAAITDPRRAPMVALRTHEPQRDVEIRAMSRDGRGLWLRVNSVPLFADGDDEPYGVVTSIVDDTERVFTRQALLERERELSLATGESGDAITQLRVAEEQARAAVVEARHQQALLEEAQMMANLGSWAFDTQTREDWSSPGLFRILGIEPTDEPLGPIIIELIHPDDRDRVIEVTQRGVASGDPYEVYYRLVRPDGVERMLYTRAATAERENGRVTRMWGTTQDVTDLRRIQVEREQAERRFRAAFEHAPIGVCSVGLRDVERGRWLTVNPAMSDLLGYDAATLLAGGIESFTHPDDVHAASTLIADLAGGAAERVAGEHRLLHRDGHVVWTLLTCAAVPDDEGGPGYAIAQLVDITDRKRSESRLRHLADHDALTGLVNRRRFEEELDRSLADAERYARAGALIVLDLDGFKYVNDTLGHGYGDRLITRLASTLRAELRESDIIARLGGDEFGVILPEADAERAVGVADKLLAAVARDGVVADETRHARVTASAGIALFEGEDGLSSEELLIEADIAMYEAKESGRNRATVHHRDGDGQGPHVTRLSWLERIRSALAEDRFVLYAQPIVSLDAGKDTIPSYELLLRMRTADGDLTPPATFLHIAERFDLVQDIDRWVISRAVALLRREHQAGRPVILSVNLSGRTMGDANFAGWLEELLVREPVPAGRLIFEITETAAIVSLDRAQALGDTLRRLGCLLALDDFGAGFASFGYLKHLSFDVLKIDGEFIRGLHDNPTDRLVVEAVVGIARGLGKPSLAEFVTDARTLETVRSLGIDFAQGFHLGRPIPVEVAFGEGVASDVAAA